MKQKAFILGLGISGKSAAAFLLSLGYEVYALDQNSSSDLPAGVQPVHEKDSLEGFSLCIVSPGISLNHPWVQKAQQHYVKIIGEAELGFKHLKQKAIGITGTNGKTTVTLLVEHVLRHAGKKAKATGNVGYPLTRFVEEASIDTIAVIELSSYQIETLETKALDVAILLNLTPDHLDRYGSMEAYAYAKIKLEHCLKEGGVFYVHESVADAYPHLFMFDFQRFGSGFSSHEKQNLQAAYLLCSHFGVTETVFDQAVKTFKKPSHRIEFVKSCSGVDYFDDSKGTNIDAVIKAVEEMKGPTVLIAGGVDKGSSYLPWKEAFQDKVKKIILIGQAAHKISQELSLFFNVEIVDSLANAVDLASKVASCGDCVLLSPGCSSFDMFRDYVHRGEEFQRLVCLLEEREKIHEP